MSDNIRDIVSQILQSPQLRESLENTVRSLTTTTSTVLSPQATAASASVTQSYTPMRQELSRLFPSVRERNANHRVRSRVTSRQPNPVTFSKDVILLQSPQSNHTLRGSVKSAAYETGFAVSAVEFQSNWTFPEIKTHIRSIFSLLTNVDFELVVPVAGRVTKIVLQQGVQLNGFTLRRLYHQKVVYVRPYENLCDHNNYNSERGEQFEVPNLVPNDSSSVSTNTELSSLELGINNAEISNLLEISNTQQSPQCNNLGNNPLLEDILQNLRVHINETVSLFNVYRQDIFNCCIRAMQRKTFDPFNKIDVKFSDIEGLTEGAVDVGGPTREMFRLVLTHIKSSRMFVGNDKKFITLNSGALENNEYFFAGRIITLSLLHGGPGPHFFSETLFMALIEGIDKCTPSLEFLDYDVAGKIRKISDIDNLVDLQEYIINEAIFAIAGVYGVNNINEKDHIIQETMKFYNFHRVRPAFDQFVAGLKTCNIYNLMVDYSDSFKKVMCDDKPTLTSTIFQNIYEVVYSEMGSNKRQTENRIIAFFRDYLLDCEDDEAEVSLRELLIFSTGADAVPPLGFPWKPKFLFLHDSVSLYPKANTCGLELHLPVVHQKYKEFKYHMDFDIGNSKDFAFA